MSRGNEPGQHWKILSNWVKSGSEWEDKIIALVDRKLGQALEEMIAYYDRNFERYNTAIQVSRTIYSFGMLNELQDKLIQYRIENNQLIISDTGLLLQESDLWTGGYSIYL